MIISDKRVQRVSFLPVLNNKQSQPRVLSREGKGFDEVLKYMEEISQKVGLDTKYSVEGDEVVISTQTGT